MIQARDIKFNIEYGRYIKPIEDRCGKRLQFAKGTNHDIAVRIRKLSNKFKYYTECDHSTFDAHVTVEMLKLTHIFYQSCYHHDHNLKKLSRKTLNNNCRTRDGIKYRVTGTRMSGDVDTSLGNSLINYAILKEVVQTISGKCEVIVNGDDSVIFTNRPINIKDLCDELLKYNMESVVKPSVNNIHKIEFCRHKYIINNSGMPTMMIDPDRINEIYGMTYKQQSDYVEYLRQVCVCNIAINCTNPVGRYWLQIYESNWVKPLNFAEIKQFDRIELRTKIAALKERACAKQIDTGELNVSVVQAYGNLDSWLANKEKIIKKIKKINNLGYKELDSDRRKTKTFRISTYMIKYLPVSCRILIDHNAKRIMVSG